MKNLKNLMTAVTLLAVLVMGAISTNAGVLIGDRTAAENTCTTDTKFDAGIIISEIVGIIIGGRVGIIIGGREGIIIGGRTETCQDQSRAGVLLAD